MIPSNKNDREQTADWNPGDTRSPGLSDFCPQAVVGPLTNCSKNSFIHSFYFNGYSQILAKEWDLKTLTAGDYTVCKRVNEEDYNNFTSNYSWNQSPAYAYMEHLKEQYEKEINKTSRIIEENDHINIACYDLPLTIMK